MVAHDRPECIFITYEIILFFPLIITRKKTPNHLLLLLAFLSSLFAIDFANVKSIKHNQLAIDRLRSFEALYSYMHTVWRHLCELVLAKIEGGVVNVSADKAERC